MLSFLSFFFILIADAINQLSNASSDGTTNLLAFFRLIAVFCFFQMATKYRLKNAIPDPSLLIFKLLMAWSLFSYVRGIFTADGYFDWKYLLLSETFQMLIPLTIITGIHFETTKKTFLFIFNILFIVGFIFIPYSTSTDTEFFSRLVAIVYVIMVLIPYLKLKWRIVTIIVATISFLIDISYRSNLLHISISTSLVILFYSRYIINIKAIYNPLLVILFCMPLVFVALGATGQFNIFQADISSLGLDIDTSNDNNIKSNLNDDSRTFLYEEVTNSMNYRDSSYIIGEGPTSGYISPFFWDSLSEEKIGIRRNSEVGFLNTLLHSGSIGVGLYGLMLFNAAFLAINRSNNYLCKLFGFFLISRWLFFFMEDIVLFNMNYYGIWLVVGLCLSKKFRLLTDTQVRQFLILK